MAEETTLAKINRQYTVDAYCNHNYSETITPARSTTEAVLQMADTAMDLDGPATPAAGWDLMPPLGNVDMFQLLATLSELKQHDLEAKISFPQIVVCGQQSSGKSSLLESICGIPFPQSANVCTRFPTELCLQPTSGASSKSLSAKIIPHPDADEAQRQELGQFQRQGQELPKRHELVKLMKEVARAMGIEEKGMSRHKLLLTLTAPGLPNLTLIDLPGIFCGSSEQQSLQDGEIVKQLIRDHLENPANTILAVVSADRSIADQTIPAMIKGTSTAERTLGVVTKADTINEEVNEGLVDGHIEAVFRPDGGMKTELFGLGWHVVCNRPSNQKDVAAEIHHNTEAAFIAKGPFCRLPPERKGTNLLAHYVIQLQRDCILQALPGLRAQLSVASQACHQQLQQLKTTAGPADTRKKLTQVTRQSRTALLHSLQGTPQQRLFRGQPMAIIRARLEEAVSNFVQTLSEQGQRFHIHDNDDLPTQSEVNATFWVLDDDEDVEPSTLTPHFNRKTVLDVILDQVTRDGPLFRTKGAFDHALTQALFRFQAASWPSIAAKLIDTIPQNIEQGLRTIVRRTCEDDSSLVWETLVRKKLQKLRDELKEYTRDKFNSIFEELPQLSNADTVCIPAARSTELRRMWKSYWAGEKHPPTSLTMLDQFLTASPDMTDRMVAAEILSCMEGLYKRHRRRLEDDFTVQALMVKLNSLEDIFEPAIIDNIPDERLGSSQTTGHPDISTIEKKLESLQSAEEVFRRAQESSADGQPGSVAPRASTTPRRFQGSSPPSSLGKKRKPEQTSFLHRGNGRDGGFKKSKMEHEY